MFDFEDLIVEKTGQPKLYILKSPLEFKGSSMFIDIYYYCRTKSQIRVFNKPDVCQKTLINDRMNKVEMSTFLQDGEILLKIGSRFLHFNSEKGDFIGKMKFNDAII